MSDLIAIHTELNEIKHRVYDSLGNPPPTSSAIFCCEKR